MAMKMEQIAMKILKAMKKQKKRLQRIHARE
jgi:hypothetical protein